MRTVTQPRKQTLTSVSKGSVRLAAVSPLGTNRSPLAVRGPLPYHDARSAWALAVMAHNSASAARSARMRLTSFDLRKGAALNGTAREF